MSLFSPASKVEAIPFAGIRRVFEKAEQLAAQGVKVIHFEIGRPDFDTPENIKQAAVEALHKGFVHYTPNVGILPLRKTLAEIILRDKNVSYDPEKEIMVTAGGQQALFLTFTSLLNEGDEVLVPDPGYGQYTSGARLAGAVPLPVPLIEGHNSMMDLAYAQDLVSPRTRMIVLNSPHNPTGGVLTRGQIEEVCDFAQKHGLIIVSDEAYDRILYEGEAHISPASLDGMDKITVMCGSLSKTYAMTGWRIGYIAAPPELIAASIKVQQNVLLSICSFAQFGALEALRGSQESVRNMVGEFDKRRQVILEGIEKCPGLESPVAPMGAFYFFVRFNVPEFTSVQMCDYLLDNAAVAVVPGNTFGANGEGYLRISFATSYEDCCEGMERINSAMRKLLG